jgi:hypothetical protein
MSEKSAAGDFFPINKQKTPRNARRLQWTLAAPDYDYFETERRNIRSIFSFVASQQLWLAWAAARA